MGFLFICICLFFVKKKKRKCTIVCFDIFTNISLYCIVIKNNAKINLIDIRKILPVNKLKL